MLQFSQSTQGEFTHLLSFYIVSNVLLSHDMADPKLNEKAAKVHLERPFSCIFLFSFLIKHGCFILGNALISTDIPFSL